MARNKRPDASKGYNWGADFQERVRQPGATAIRCEHHRANPTAARTWVPGGELQG